MYSQNKLNPVFELYEANEKNVSSSKENLFSNLERINPKIRLQIESLYHSKKKNNPLPFLGELYPWFISDLFQIENKEIITNVSEGWLGLYYYTIFIDDLIDLNSRNIDSKQLISLTALMKEGLLKLYNSVSGTKYEYLFSELLNNALNQGKNEELLQGIVGNKENKLVYTKHKNDLIKICALGIIAKSEVSEDKANAILEFTDKMQLSFQFLDDITDLKEDYIHRNYTVILDNLISKSSKSNLNSDNLIESLVQKNILLDFLCSLNELFIDIENSISKSRKSSSTQYINSVSFLVNDFYEFLKVASPNFIGLSQEKKNKIVVDIEKRIEILAITT